MVLLYLDLHGPPICKQLPKQANDYDVKYDNGMNQKYLKPKMQKPKFIVYQLTLIFIQ